MNTQGDDYVPRLGERRLLLGGNIEKDGVRKVVPRRFNELYEREMAIFGNGNKAHLRNSEMVVCGESRPVIEGGVGRNMVLPSHGKNDESHRDLRLVGMLGISDDHGVLQRERVWDSNIDSKRDFEEHRRQSGAESQTRTMKLVHETCKKSVRSGVLPRKGTRKYIFAGQISSHNSVQQSVKAKCELFIASDPTTIRLSTPGEGANHWSEEQPSKGCSELKASRVNAAENTIETLVKPLRDRSEKAKGSRDNLTRSINESIDEYDKPRTEMDVVSYVSAEPIAKAPFESSKNERSVGDEAFRGADHNPSLRPAAKNTCLQNAGSTGFQGSMSKERTSSSMQRRGIPRNHPQLASRTASTSTNRTQQESICCFCPPPSFFGGEEMNDKLIGPFLLSTKDRRRIRCHQRCACWAPRVYVDRGTGEWRRVVDEYRRGRLLKCAECKQRGATVGCFEAKCHKVWHYRCLRISSAKPKLITKHFAAFCSSHARYANSESVRAQFEEASGRIGIIPEAREEGSSSAQTVEAHYMYTKLLAGEEMTLEKRRRQKLNEEELLATASKLRKHIRTVTRLATRKLTNRRWSSKPFLVRNLRKTLQSLRQGGTGKSERKAGSECQSCLAQPTSPKRRGRRSTSQTRFSQVHVNQSFKSPSPQVSFKRKMEVLGEPKRVTPRRKATFSTPNPLKSTTEPEIRIKNSKVQGITVPERSYSVSDVHKKSTYSISSAALPSWRAEDTPLHLATSKYSKPKLKRTSRRFCTLPKDHIDRKHKLITETHPARPIKRRQALSMKGVSRSFLSSSSVRDAGPQGKGENRKAGLFSSNLYLPRNEDENGNDVSTRPPDVANSVLLPPAAHRSRTRRQSRMDWEEVFALDEDPKEGARDDATRYVLPAPAL